MKLTEPVVRHSHLEFFIDPNILEHSKKRHLLPLIYYCSLEWGLSKREIVVNQVIGKGEFGGEI